MPWVARVRAGLAVLVACIVVGCQLVAGDFEIEDPVAGQESPAATCKSGDFRCNREYLLACGAKGGEWLLQQTCGSADLCDSKGHHCEVCEPGDLRCDAAIRQECNPDGAGWHEVEKCAEASICNPTFCGNCTPGEYSCRGDSSAVGNELWQCGEDGTWSVKLDECASEGLCMASLDAARAGGTWDMKCMSVMCEAGTFTCEGTVLRHCRQDQTAWEVVDTCLTPELCALGVTNAAANAGVIDMCPAGCGTAGGFLCEGTKLEECRADLTGYDLVTDCPVDTECNPLLGACTDLCTPGEYQCNGSTLRFCTTGRHWTTQSECASAPLCQASADPAAPGGQCVQPGCPHAGDYSCDGVTLSKCRDDLMAWEPVETCASPELCIEVDKRCQEPTCAPGELRCFDAELRACNAALDGWDVLETCAAGQFCSNDVADPGCKMECPSATRCNGSELQQCTPNGWQHQATCGTNELCSCTLDGGCTLGSGSDGCGVMVCGGALASYQCEGSELQRCADGRNGWLAENDCGDPALCYPGVAPTYEGGYCAVCPLAGEVRCATGSPSATLIRCSPDRTMWSTIQSCSSAYGCIDAGTQDYCAACSAGQVMCSGPTLQKCAADLKGFVNTTCMSQSLCDQPNGQCDVCTPNSNDCVGSRLDHCSSDGQILQSQTCPKVCDEVMGQCDGCVANTSRCSDKTLFKCSSDGQSEASTPCATAALCNYPQQRCDTPVCAVGEHQCDGAQPQICNTNRNGWDDTGNPCGSAALCIDSSGTCIPPTCGPTSHHCNGAQPQICNTDRTMLVDSGNPCATPALCAESTGVCTPPACALTDRKCMGAQPQQCNSDRTGYAPIGSACATPALCVGAGVCNNPTCGVMQPHCNGAQPQVCNADRTAYMNVGSPCATAALCTEATGACTTATCAVNARQCDMDQPQVCNADRNGWDDDGNACAAGHCLNGACTFCALNEKHCDDEQPQICNASRTAWQDNGDPCASIPLCMNGTCTMATCMPGESHCMGTQLQTCNANQNGWDTQTCTTAGLCDEMAGVCHAAACATDAYQCDEERLQKCKADRSGWDTVDTCDSADLCDLPGKECDECVAPAFSCSMNVLSECSDTGHFAVLEDCMAGTCDATAGMCTPP